MKRCSSVGGNGSRVTSNIWIPHYGRFEKALLPCPSAASRDRLATEHQFENYFLGPVLDVEGAPTPLHEPAQEVGMDFARIEAFRRTGF